MTNHISLRDASSDCLPARIGESVKLRYMSDAKFLKKIRHRKRSGIYMIVNQKNGMKYIGKSKDVHRRICDHMRSNGKTSLLKDAVEKCGLGAFRWAVLEWCGAERLDEREHYWISTLQTYEPLGYNIRTAGKSQHQRALSCPKQGNLFPP